MFNINFIVTEQQIIFHGVGPRALANRDPDPKPGSPIPAPDVPFPPDQAPIEPVRDPNPVVPQQLPQKRLNTKAF